MFHVEPEAVFGRDGSLSFERPDRMSHEGTAAVPEALAFVGSDAHPIKFRWNCAGVSGGTAPVFPGRRQTRTPDGLDVSRGTGRCVWSDGTSRFGRQDRMTD